jgi:hypothetical protein
VPKPVSTLFFVTHSSNKKWRYWSTTNKAEKSENPKYLKKVSNILQALKKNKLLKLFYMLGYKLDF